MNVHIFAADPTLSTFHRKHPGIDQFVPYTEDSPGFKPVVSSYLRMIIIYIYSFLALLMTITWLGYCANNDFGAVVLR